MSPARVSQLRRETAHHTEPTCTLRINRVRRWEIAYGPGEYDSIELTRCSVCEVQIDAHGIRSSFDPARATSGAACHDVANAARN
jgi:hypothetical protein